MYIKMLISIKRNWAIHLAGIEENALFIEGVISTKEIEEAKREGFKNCKITPLQFKKAIEKGQFLNIEDGKIKKYKLKNVYSSHNGRILLKGKPDETVLTSNLLYNFFKKSLYKNGYKYSKRYERGVWYFNNFRKSDEEDN